MQLFQPNFRRISVSECRCAVCTPKDINNFSEKRKMKRATFILTCLLLVSPCGAAAITVDDDGPADFNNIQAAINDSNDWDVIVVADGTYTGWGNRDIDFRGKAITVRSENGPENCIIDCEGSNEDPHVGFYFHRDEDANSVLDGFTVINAGGWGAEKGCIYCLSSPKIANCNISTSKSCGIHCRLSEDSSPIIDNCKISNCGSSGIRLSYGYNSYSTVQITDCLIEYNNWDGILDFCSNHNCSVIQIDNCQIRYNVNDGIDFGTSSLTATQCTIRNNGGSGIISSSMATGSYPSANIRDCVITNNSGGGIGTRYATSVTIADCHITGNSGHELYQGGGILLGGSSSTVANCLISDNRHSRSGGGINSAYSRGESTIADCVIINNSTNENGGGIYNGDMSITITNCLLSGNFAEGFGGGICFYETATITNCTITANSANQKGGGIYFNGEYWDSSPPTTITNTIFANNTKYAIYEFWLDEDPIVTYCHFHNNPDGDYYDEETGSQTGASNINNNIAEASDNIDGDTLFVTGTLGHHYLSQISAGQVFDSPCVDAGSGLASSFSFSQLPTRTDSIADTGIIDIGYHYAVEEPNNFTLTVNVEPDDVGIETVIPPVGNHNCDGWINISAEQFIDCPDVYKFNHWIGDVTDVNSANTTVFIDSDKTITAVFVATKECGDECHPILKGDLNEDCYINFEDFTIYSELWLSCTHPDCDQKPRLLLPFELDAVMVRRKRRLHLTNPRKMGWNWLCDWGIIRIESYGGCAETEQKNIAVMEVSIDCRNSKNRSSQLDYPSISNNGAYRRLIVCHPG